MWMLLIFYGSHDKGVRTYMFIYMHDKQNSSSAYWNRFNETWEKVQVGKDQEKAQSDKDSHSKNRGGKN